MTTRTTLWAVVAWLAATSCIYPRDAPAGVPTPLSIDPEIRIGLPAVDAATLLGNGGLRFRDPSGTELGVAAAGGTVAAAVRGGVVSLRGAGVEISGAMLMVSSLDSSDVVDLGGRSYRGAMELRPVGGRLLVVNIIGLEDYLAGVVGAEMGPRAVGEEAALRAQAVASRTYALRNLGRWREQGYDLSSDVAAQVYAGVLHESPASREAVIATRGQVLTWQGELIEAFYSSTCAGHTEAGLAVFPGGDKPYLLAAPDTAPGGNAWCAISPRYQWTETWTGAQLTDILRRTLAAERLSTSRVNDLRDINVIDRTTSRRVGSLELIGARGKTLVAGQAIRRVLSPVSGGWLRSTDFRIRISTRGARIDRLTVEGRGNGHGVGLCQWGAIGRARAGQDYISILMSYFPGTQLDQRY